MRVDPARPARRALPVVGQGRDDAARADAGAQQHDEVVPDGVEDRRVVVAARPERVEPLAEQHLGAVDVADARDDRLVHQQGGDRRPAAQHAGHERLDVRAAAQRVRAEPGQDDRALGVGQDLARGRAAQLQPVVRRRRAAAAARRAAAGAGRAPSRNFP